MVNFARLVNIRFWSSMTTSSVLLVIYSANLVRVYRGSNHKFVKSMIVLLMLTNVGVIVHQGLVKELNNSAVSNPNKNPVLIGTLTAEAIAVIVECGCFNVSHWMFGFQYYQIARHTNSTL